MGLENGSDNPYDLRRIEDIFACLEIISIARGALFGVDPKLAARMEQVSDALGAFSQLVLEGGLHEVEEGVHESQPFENPVPSFSDEAEPDILDLTVDLHKSTGKSGTGSRIDPHPVGEPGDDNSIVDILTGEKIR